MEADRDRPPDLEEIQENKFSGLFHLTEWLSTTPLGVPGLPLLVAGLLLGGLPWLLRRGQRATQARAIRILGGQALGFSGLDLALMAALPALKLSYAPVRSAWLDLFLGRAGIAGLGTALALGSAVRGHALRPGGRRALLAGSLAAHAGMTAAVVYATYIDAQRLMVTYHPLRFPGHTPGAPPLHLRLAHVSDMHIERISRRDEATVARLGAAQADLILLTGDYLSNDYTQDAQARADLGRLLAALVALHPAHGVFAVLGNNDPPQASRRILADAGVRVLNNRAVTLRLGGRRVQILGARMGQDDDWWDDVPRLEVAANQADAQARSTPPDLRVLLYHTPDLAPQAAAEGVDLYLCGHTHGGQVRLPGLGALLTASRFGQRYALGLQRLPNGGYIYTTSGTGFEGLGLPRLRVLDPPEVVVFDMTVG